MVNQSGKIIDCTKQLIRRGISQNGSGYLVEYRLYNMTPKTSSRKLGQKGRRTAGYDMR